MPAPESPGQQSFLNDSSRGEFADPLPDTGPYFEAWLESLRPSPKTIDSAQPSQFTFEGTLRLDGYVTGVVRSQKGTLIISETAALQANIFVATAIVDGLVRGNIHATESVDLGSQARVIGNIETPTLAIQPGAMFAGQCDSLPSPLEKDDGWIATTSVGDSTGSQESPRQTRSKPDQPEETEAMAVATGR